MIRQAGSEQALGLEEDLYLMLLPLFRLVGDIGDREREKISEMEGMNLAYFLYFLFHFISNEIESKESKQNRKERSKTRKNRALGNIVKASIQELRVVTQNTFL